MCVCVVVFNPFRRHIWCNWALEVSHWETYVSVFLIIRRRIRRPRDGPPERFSLQKLDVRDIKFTQTTISNTFTDTGAPISTLIDVIRADGVPETMPTIRVVLVDGEYRSLDNRRLYCMKEGLKRGRGDSQHIEVKVVELDEYVQLEFVRKNRSHNVSRFILKRTYFRRYII